MPRKDGRPRKVVIGTTVYPMYGWFPPLETRLDALADVIDNMAREASVRYSGKRLDVAVLPEVAVTGERGGAAKACLPLEGPVLEKMGGKARQHGCYIVLPMFLAEGKDEPLYSNAAVLVDRKGKVAGIYHKVHAVPSPKGVLEGGVAAGKDFSVFRCDFGKVGMQICYDMMYGDGWPVLARKGAEVVFWPTQSPQTAQPADRALANGYYVVSSTWRNNASVFEPTGMVAAQIRQPGVLVQEIDLSYVILPWSAKLRDGAAMAEAYGDRVGYNYYRSEDCGIFWSNDPKTPIGQMVRKVGLVERHKQWEHDRRLQDKARGGPPSLE